MAKTKICAKAKAWFKEFGRFLLSPLTEGDETAGASDNDDVWYDDLFFVDDVDDHF